MADERSELERRLSDLGMKLRQLDNDRAAKTAFEAAERLAECRRALAAARQRWGDVDPEEIFTFRDDVKAWKGLFVALAKLEGREP